MANEIDVLVVGAGNAGLSAALAATDAGARVTVLEAAPEHLRGGNTYFTGGGFRFPYDGIEDTLIGVQNNSSTPLSSLPLASTDGAQLFGFDGDGIGNYGPTGYEGPGCEYRSEFENVHWFFSLSMSSGTGSPGDVL